MLTRKQLRDQKISQLLDQVYAETVESVAYVRPIITRTPYQTGGLVKGLNTSISKAAQEMHIALYGAYALQDTAGYPDMTDTIQQLNKIQQQLWSLIKTTRQRKEGR